MNPIRCISLWQPWGSLLFAPPGVGKRVETRHWDTPFRGLMAIHASKAFRPDCRELCTQPWYREAIAAMGYKTWRDMPTGCVLGTLRLVRTFKISAANLPKFPELAFGDYTPGRFGWVTVQPRLFRVPIIAAGRQGPWSWTPPAELESLYAEPGIAAPAQPAETGMLFG